MAPSNHNIENPYVGPQPFEQKDQDRFFGREREANELLSLVIANRMSLLYAQSGAGKTSLLNAKLFPMLAEREFEVFPVARVRGLIPSNIPPEDVPNPFVFNTLISWSDEETDLKSLSRETLSGYLGRKKHVTDSTGLPAPRIIIFDQFEELFTAYPDRWRDREGFFDQVVAALQGDSVFFRPEDVRQPAGLIATLRNKENPLSNFLAPQFSQGMQEMLHKADTSGEINKKQVGQLVSELNRLIRRQGLFKEDKIAHASIVAQAEMLLDQRPGIQTASNLNKLIRANNLVNGNKVDALPFPREVENLVQDNPRGAALQKLNRMLLEEAYPEHLPRTAIGDPLLRVLFVIREDFIAQLDPYVPDLPNQLRSRLRLMRLQQRAALEAVKKPLQHTHRSFDAGVAERLVDELLKINVETEYGDVVSLKGEYVEPVQLQVVCENLWNDLPREINTITDAHVQEFGDVNEALSAFYESTIAATVESAGISESTLRRFFENKLLTPAGTRGTVYRGANETGDISNEAIDVLEDRHIIRGEWRGGSRWYELTHDRFIEPILRSNESWFSKNVDGREILQWLEKKARRWEGNEKKTFMLLEGFELQRAERWMASPAASEFEIDILVRRFTNESRKHLDATIIAKERTTAKRYRFAAIGLLVLAMIAGLLWVQAARKQSDANDKLEEATEQSEIARLELDAAQKSMQLVSKEKELAVVAERNARVAQAKAEEQLQEARESLREATKKYDEAQVSLLEANNLVEQADEDLLLANTANAQARRANDEAQEELEEANRQRSVAREELSIASKKLNQAIAIALADVAIRQQRIGNDSLGALLAKQAFAFDRQGNSPFQGQVYEALRLTLNGLSNDGSRRIAVRKGGPRILVTYAGPVRRVSYSPDGKWLASVAENDQVQLMNLSTNQSTDIGNPIADPSCLRFSPDAAELAVCRTGQSPVFWDLSGPAPVKQANSLPFGFDARDIVYSPRAQVLGFIGTSGRIYRWHKKEGGANEDGITILARSAAFKAMATSPDGKYLVAADMQGRLFVWINWTEKEPDSRIFPGAEHTVNAITFSPDNVSFATGGNDHVIRIWKIQNDGEALAVPVTLAGHLGPVNDLAFSNNGDLLASASSDETVHVRRVKSVDVLEKKPRILQDHLGGIWSVAFSSDNKHIASGSEDQTMRIWITDSQDFVDEICKILPGKALTQEQWDTFVGDDFDIDQYQKPC